ncbi:hypothetical protein T11_1411 [Trichinella zimbabwensis]|uniref:Uncharacterized protein n=1 Tax=Trichinella zimbabwensis TaxID=268475 RepID=A0A0V1HLV8_9BILA|nr:hypothetical protein T11_1411 [Trichinella zimbabwensis]
MLYNGGIKHIISQSVISGSCSSSMCYELRVGTELSKNSHHLEESDCSYSTILLIQKDEYATYEEKNQFLKNRSDRGELFEQCNLSQCFVRFDRLERTVFSSSSSSPSSSTSYFTTPAKHIRRHYYHHHHQKKLHFLFLQISYKKYLFFVQLINLNKTFKN